MYVHYIIFLFFTHLKFSIIKSKTKTQQIEQQQEKPLTWRSFGASEGGHLPALESRSTTNWPLQGSGPPLLYSSSKELDLDF